MRWGMLMMRLSRINDGVLKFDQTIPLRRTPTREEIAVAVGND